MDIKHKIERFFLSDRGVVTFALMITLPIVAFFFLILSHTK